MKKTMIVIIAVIMVMSVSLSAREEIETLSRGHRGGGFFGGPVMKITKIDGETGVLVGGRLGWNFNRVFSIGLAGYGWVHDYGWDHHHGSFFDNWDGPQMGYGGLYLEGIIGSNKVIHLTAGVLLGAGGVTGDWFDDHHWWDKADAFFVAEPEINLEVNVTKYFRVGIGASYRFITGVNHHRLTNDDLSGMAGTLTFKFGKF